jgi:hypothetical protein
MKLLALFAAAALLAAPAAAAKGPDTARICGVSQCITVTSVDRVNDLALMSSGFGMRTAPRPEPFFTIELTSSRQEAVRWSFLYVPSASAIRIIRADFSGTFRQNTSPAWVSPSRSVATAYANATATMEPYPADAEWVPRAGGRSVPWLVVLALAVAGAIGALLVVRTWLGLTRRSRTLARG